MQWAGRGRGKTAPVCLPVIHDGVSVRSEYYQDAKNRRKAEPHFMQGFPFSSRYYLRLFSEQKHVCVTATVEDYLPRVFSGRNYPGTKKAGVNRLFR